MSDERTALLAFCHTVRLRHVLVVAVAGALALFETAAAAQTGARSAREDSDAEGEHPIPDKDKDPLRGSTFLFDQSMSTQTAHIEPSPQQSYVPFYGWWLSLRPRWNFDDHWRLQARLDYYKEFTNSQTTTDYREDVFGDIWTDLVYSTYLAKTGPWKRTKVSLGARALWPTSKQSLAEGVFVTTGATGGISQKIPIRGDDAGSFNSARVGFAATYLHPFTTATTATNYGDFSYARQNVDGFSFVSDQLSGQTLANHTVWGILDLGLQATPKLGLTFNAILINQWHYLPAQATVATATGSATVPRNNDEQFTQMAWFILSADYEVIPEMSVGLGYYNLANSIAPDGTRRSVFGGGEDSLLWSPDARVFLDATVNLDRLFEDASGKYKASKQIGQTAEAARAARTQRIANQIR